MISLPPVLRFEHMSMCAEALVEALKSSVQSDTSARPSFFQTLNSVQRHRFPIERDGGQSPSLVWCQTEEHRAALATIIRPYPVPDDWIYSRSEFDELSKKVRKAEALIDRVDPEVGRLMRLLIGSYYFAKGGSHIEGGSSSKFIGVIWVGQNLECTVTQVAELLVHEMVHNALFLDDMIHGIHVDGEGVLGVAENQVVSAIRQIQRGYDKGFHSAYVACVLARFYRQLAEHDRSRELLSPTGDTLVGLQEKAHLLLPHGQTRLGELVAFHGQLAGGLQ
ncbi:aKG-HExxH-type peptide beta-hydroxylase [Archangium violaceum]|uniref:aKG-HExxH-type peptide beta-hydroxylase n=1 Tax=Archangium violaceum TaxID=83451 RepID=UPI0036DB4099